MGEDAAERVVIVGGGLGGVATALALTATEDLRRRYRVTLYNHGWRLGGKCASGRNAAQGYRIEEHGLHLMLGFYDTVFRFVRDAYAEWRKPEDYAFHTWRQAFSPLWQVTMMQKVDAAIGLDRWHAWNFTLPRLPGTPGDVIDIEPSAFVRLILTLLKDWLFHQPELPETLQGGDGFAALKAAHDLAHDPDAALNEERYDELLHLLRKVQYWFKRIAVPVLTLFPAGWKLACLGEFGLALLIGYLADVFPYGQAGFARINDQDYKEWLAGHGLSDQFVWSAPVKLIYDLSFAYLGGDSAAGPEAAKISAGGTLEVMFLLGLGYKEAPIWRMNAGMGDTIFTPFYEVLRDRGVEIKLFHRLHEMGLTEDGTAVARLRMGRQVDFVDGTYDPLIRVPYGDEGKFLLCWPNHPRWDQIVGGEETAAKAGNLESMWCPYQVAEVELELGRDFDTVVLAMPPAAQIGPAAALIAADPRYRQMVEGAWSVPTQSAQLWFRPTLEELGWDDGPTAMAAYAEPFDSWGEMGQTIPAEDWRVDPPKAIEYLCGVIEPPADPPPYGACGYVESLKAQVQQNAQAWLDNHARPIWPDTVHHGVFKDQLVRSSYFRFNLDPSELYVQSPPGSIHNRLAPGEASFVNLYLAGDWTRTWFSGGSAEIATLSGKQAAEAIIARRK